MAKHKKPTPQELYWERKKREEEEKDASLPPGLINHGNTCFMNSTLQGLIATRPLRDLVFFHDVPLALQPSEGSRILAKRSPQLTNGHGLGASDELAWSEGMPLGDIFITIMRKAWGIQDAKRREAMSPKEILGVIGRKYDQYLDFRQQDAHEFLRHMLDAMRMEELDIIKKRQPPSPQGKRGGHSRESNTPLPSPALPPPVHPLSGSSPVSETEVVSSQFSHTDDPSNGEKLESFVDMLFGGQLASILVCDRCKKVSITYEAFNDLSLSIKPEDYAKNRKRDRFKRIARKLRIRPPERERGDRVTQRASSVPSSPVRRSSEVAARDEPPTHEDPRRRSFDHAGAEADEARDVVKEMAGASIPLGSAIIENDEEAEEITHAEAVEAEAEGTANESGIGIEEKQKQKKDDPWGKIARRISVSMKLGGTRDKDRESRPSSRQGERGRKPETQDALRAIRSAEPRSSRTGSLAPDGSAHDVGPDPGEMSDPGHTRAPSPRPQSPRPTSPSIPSPLIQERSRPSSSRRSSANPFSRHHHRRKEAEKTSMSAYTSDEDMAYIRRVLADVHPITGNPLSILHDAFSGSANGSSTNLAGSTTLATQALWAKLGHLPGIEECLRMFTTVEILDGENMVGCHRCWKIANGLYTPPPREHGSVPACLVDDSDESGGESSAESSDERTRSSSASADDKYHGTTMKASMSGSHPVVSAPHRTGDSAPQSSPELSSGQVSPASTSVVSAPAAHSSSTTSVSSAPTTVDTSVSSTEPLAHTHSRKDSVVPPETYGGLPIPKISTTEPETPGSAPAGQTFNIDRGPAGGTLSRTWSTPGVVGVSQSNDSLLTPRVRRRKRPKGSRNNGTEESGDSSDDEFDDSESDTSAPTSTRSDGSVSPSMSPSASPNSSVEKLGDVSPLASLRPHHHGRRGHGGAQLAKVPRAKQVVLRKMYKRYLISTPPPILVIHLKRFQQAAKMHHISLSGGFKKLDDFVAFPERLDLAPFLAPRRQDFAHNPEKTEKEKEKEKSKQRERCMYRLYAVVVHIGNMLGGHYVAYTALPQDPPPTPAVDSEKPHATPSLPSQEPRPSQAHPRQWAYISDTVVRLATLEEVLKAKAYICMYERV
ncbi:hypothetical protein BC628DRAFT_1321380 [Trametes gibbosa]|nr:hypothetical protein BC628DRAFT_1321380 [Trametes gibbosa]